MTIVLPNTPPPIMDATNPTHIIDSSIEYRRIAPIALVILCAIGASIYFLRNRSQPALPQKAIFTRTHKDHSFEVYEVGIHEKEEIKRLISSWIDLTKGKMNKTHKDFYLSHDYPKNYKDLPFLKELFSLNLSLPRYYYLEDEDLFTPVQKTRDQFNSNIALKFVDLAFILGYLEDEIDYGYSIVACRSVGKIQALAYYSPENHELKHIATHPDNIKLPINNDCRVAGAASSIIAYLATKASAQDKDLSLKSVPQATKFYESLHFEKKQDPSQKRLYVLTAAKVRELTENGIPPFDKKIV